MKEFFQLMRRFVSPYKKYLVGAVGLNILSAVFNIFSFTLLIPILQILFKIDNKVYDFIPWNADESLKTIAVNNINQPRMLSTHILVYTPEWGKYSPAAPKYGVGLQVIDNKITKASANAVEIPQNGYVISGPKSILYALLDKKDVELSIKTNPDWDGVKHIISGGPYLVKNGEVFVDMTAQRLQAIGGRNPRSAIGYTKENNFIFVAVDGREGSSIGMTLMELANFMQSIGCVGAINLDGGGSTVMYVNGRVVNKPQQTGGIPLSNAIILSKSNQS